MSHGPDLRKSFMIAADPDVVYAALTTQAGLESWWTDSVIAGCQVGDLIRLRWSDNDFTVMRIDLLEPCAAVQWTCSLQHDTNLPASDEWIGSVIRFGLEPSEVGTSLTITHHGLLDLDCGEICSRGWDSYLGGSLKRYVENGAGDPWTVGAAG